MSDEPKNEVAARLADVRERVARAAESDGRPGGVVLVAVSKAQPADAIRRAHAAGQRDFGENYVQELVQKSLELADLPGLRFHLIGHLQRNKAKLAVGVVSAVHSADSVELVRELDRRAVAVPAERRVFGADPRLAILVELNIAGETQKSGCAPDELGAVLEAVEAAANLRLAGLTCVPPFDDDPGASRPHFEALSRLQNEHGGPGRLPELSMGMTADFEHAIAAGATVVRVGTAIFGPRRS